MLKAFFNRADICACHCRKSTDATNDVNTVRLIVTTTPAQPNLAANCVFHYSWTFSAINSQTVLAVVIATLQTDPSGPRGER